MICIWSSWCCCHPVISCFIKIQNGFTFLVPVYPGCHGKEAVKWVFVCFVRKDCGRICSWKGSRRRWRRLCWTLAMSLSTAEHVKHICAVQLTWEWGATTTSASPMTSWRALKWRSHTNVSSFDWIIRMVITTSGQSNFTKWLHHCHT